MSESKSYLIFLATIIVAMYCFIGYNNYTEMICKTELSKSTRTVEEGDVE